MSDEVVVRLVLVAAVAATTVVLAMTTRRWQRPHHPPIDVTGLGLPPGIVVFTSTDCSGCGRARAVVEALGTAVREVTWELEPHLLGTAGVRSVPLTIVVGPDGAIVDQMVGVPRRRRLRRALERMEAGASR